MRYSEAEDKMCYTDDPVADFERHDAEQQEKLDKLPKCADCGQPIQDDYLYDLNGDLFCKKCMTANFRRPVDDYIEE
jgi:formylmethanofuran dehydrogenase subunit E